MLAPPSSRPLVGATFAARRATFLLSHTAKEGNKRQEAAIRAVEQLRWLQRTQRPLKWRLWGAAVQQLAQNVTALRVSVHFPHLLAAASVLSQERPLRHEYVLMQILLHHVLQRPAEAAAAVGCYIDQDDPDAASRLPVAAAQETVEAALTSVAPAATSHLTDQQLLQLLLCWDNAAALRPCLEALARPLLRSLVCRASQRSGQPQAEWYRERAVRPRAGFVPADGQAAEVQLRNSTDYCCSSGDSGTAFVSSENKSYGKKRYSMVNSQALSNGRRILASCESGETAAHVNAERAAASAAAAQLSQELQLLKFLGRHLDTLLLLEQERPSALTSEVKPLTGVQQQGPCRHRPAQFDGISRASPSTSSTATLGANYDGTSHTEGCSSVSDSTHGEEAVAYFRLREQLRTSIQRELPRQCAVRRAGGASKGCPHIVCATWRNLLHCYDSWRGYGKRFGWREDHAARVLPELILSGARVLLALLQHLQAVVARREGVEQQATDALVLHLSKMKQRQQQSPKRLGCQMLQRECRLQQLSSCTAVQSRAMEGGRVLDKEDVAGSLAPALHYRRRWGNCSTEGAVCSLESRLIACFQVQDLQQLADNFQRQLLQLPLQCLSHSQALVQIPAAACLLRLLHEVSSYLEPKLCNRQQLQEKVVSESGVRRWKLQRAEANDDRQQQQKQQHGGSTKTEQAAWSSLSLSVDQHIRRERGRREATALQLEDVCDCLNAVRLIEQTWGALRGGVLLPLCRSDSLFILEGIAGAIKRGEEEMVLVKHRTSYGLR